MIIVITGNPVDGLFFYGPFATPELATEWAQKEGQKDWWIGNLEAPKDDETI